MTLPTFLVIGARRSGTTWLDACLRSHPEIYMPARRKEIHFFDQHFSRGVGWYESFFTVPREGYRAVGETTPGYMFSPLASKRIWSVLGPIKLIAILRDPVERAYSDFKYACTRHTFSGSFREYLSSNPDAVARGCYAEQLERYYRYWSRDSLLVLRFEVAVHDPEATFADIARHLGVAPGGFAVQLGVRNASYVPRAPKARAAATQLARLLRAAGLDRVVESSKRMGIERVFRSAQPVADLSRQDRETLDRIYRQDLARLKSITGVDLTR